MSSAIAEMRALLVGALLGAIFFGGLWWTVRHGAVANNPAVWFPVSLLLRSGLVIVGFYYVAAAGWPALVLCACGFLIARVVAFRSIRVTSAHAP